MSFEAHTLAAADGHRIHIRFRASVGEHRGVVQILHGMAEHADRYARFAEVLAADGWSVVAHDHRGHGPHTPDAALGHFADRGGWALVLDDVRAVRAWARKRAPEGKLALFGHSMGSFIATSDQLRAPGTVDLMVLSGGNRGGGALVRAGLGAAKLERLRQGPHGRSAALDFLSFGSFNKAFEPARTKFDWLSRDSSEVDEYVADARCGFRCTNQLWVDLLEALIELGDEQRLARLEPSLPVHLMCGERDPVSSGGKGVRELAEQLRSVGLSKVDLRIYPGGRHEMLNETNRDEVMADVCRWLAATPT